ncbi:MAG: uridine diphosphate-N-acetylglucosamine-binding protein YvcK [Actinomycetaceae bacterium]|nr:uridine diphosphate-N-acetylglucosamine-binding protein YvcK [Actinomycetaceae bacterium]
MGALLDSDGWPRRGVSGTRVVAFGGGHGLSATLRALKHITHQLTAVVTVADDGGSSGRLREEMNVLPPGDLRMALASLCDDSEWGLTWRDVMQHRFQTDGPLDRHAVGNLLIVALWELLGDQVDGLDWIARLLGAHGRVLPMAQVPLEIEADVEDADGTVNKVRGQCAVASTDGRMRAVRLFPADPPVDSEVLTAISEAEWVVLGPGSWYTSVLPHLLVPKLRSALVSTNARRALILNLTTQKGETDSLSAGDHIRVLQRHAPDLALDVVIAEPSTVDDIEDLENAAREMGARLLLRQVSIGGNKALHDPLRLAAALRDAFDGVLGEVGRREPWLA